MKLQRGRMVVICSGVLERAAASKGADPTAFEHAAFGRTSRQGRAFQGKTADSVATSQAISGGGRVVYSPANPDALRV